MVFLFLHMFKWLFQGKSNKQETQLMSKKFLIVGLGNIGAEYVCTRHNIGFKVLNHLAKQNEIEFETRKLGALATYKFKGRTFLLLKPNTFMNLSGKAVKYWLDKENIPLENLLVITDDLNLPFGTLRLKTKGSNGGHNGLKDIANSLNTSKFTRLRFGIGNNFKKKDQVDFVLSKWNNEESNNLGQLIDKNVEIIFSTIKKGTEFAMNKYN